MKKALFLSLAAICIFSLSTFAQKGKAKTFEGQISYTIEYLTELDAATKAQAPTEIIQYFKGNKMRLEQITAMGKVVVISDQDTKEQVVLIDMMGQKWAIKSTKEETEKALSETPKATVTVGTETKSIAGYTCTKAEVVTGESTETFWYTSDLGLENPNWNMPWSDIKGLLMEYTQTQGEISSKIVAKEVKKGKQKDTQFTVPSDYQQMTSQEFQNMFGGGE
ncbi:MAG: hypothetical protein CVU05_09090 [Bacteroidetes bacterium HGW-Bacteroidetes-21]|jgi:GLPGLI family protein|nr:MAG: hypothetical protein CVU05_09090 [Bacteroidetes bacterium HGW-Bacteroidetes-21]